MGLNFSAYNTEEIIDFLQEQVKDGIVKTDKDSLQTASYSQNLPGQHGLALAPV
jgi:glycolate oxidase